MRNPSGSSRTIDKSWESRGQAHPFTRRWSVLALALGLDALFGEVPLPIHPVAWMGRLITLEQRYLPPHGPIRQVTSGGVVVGGNILLALTAGWRAGQVLHWLPLPVGVGVEALVLSTLLSQRMLAREALGVSRLVEHGHLAEARSRLRTLVSRPTDDLEVAAVLAAATESVAENTSDSLIAPMLAYAVGGLPGATVYRMANTMDAMLGYRGEYEYLGKAAARLDDLLNWLPARVTAMLLLVASPLVGGNLRQGWRIGRRDAGKTASPNAGWPMATVAGILGVRLEKSGQYILGAGLPVPEVDVIQGAVRLMRAAALLLLGVLGVVLLGNVPGRQRKRLRLSTYLTIACGGGR